MSKGKKIALTIIAVLGIAAVSFAGICIYGVYDYIHRCVKTTAREHYPVVRTGEEYCIDEFFTFERTNDTTEYFIYINGDNIEADISEDGRHFTITEGEGTAVLSAYGMNSDSPEAISDHIDITIDN